MSDASTELEPSEASPAVADPGLSLGSQLCTQCGLCCTGALHRFAVLDPDELDFAASLGLTLRTDGKPGFALPCRHLAGTLCSIYTNRPKVCGRYQCRQLDEVSRGDTALESALDKVRTAKSLYQAAVDLLPPGTSLPDARSSIAEPAATTAGSPDYEQEMQLRLAITTLSVYLDRNFRNSSEGNMLTMTAVGQAKEENTVE